MGKSEHIPEVDQSSFWGLAPAIAKESANTRGQRCALSRRTQVNLEFSSAFPRCHFAVTIATVSVAEVWLVHHETQCQQSGPVSPSSTWVSRRFCTWSSGQVPMCGVADRLWDFDDWQCLHLCVPGDTETEA